MFSLIGAFYYLRVVKVMYFDEPAAGRRDRPRPRRGALLAANGLAVLLFGLFSGGLLAMCRDAIVAALTT